MMNMMKKLSMVGVIILVVLVGLCFNSLVETNNSENYQVKQAAVSGDLSVRSTPGMYGQMFGSIETYRLADDYHFLIKNVLFRDGSSADVTGTVRFRLPVTDEDRIKLHREAKTYDKVKLDLVKNAVDGALVQSAKLFGAEEVYSTESADFIQIFMEQINNGIYKTRAAGQVNQIVTDENGVPAIAKSSILKQYGIVALNVEISKLDFDEKTDQLIQSRKEAEQQETLARAEAERAKQDAITVEERGKATVAKVKYEALAVKEKAVIEAEKQTAIEEEKTKQALEYAKQVEASKKAEAAGNLALVNAGLTPLEEAQIQRDTEIGVAEALAGMNWPQVMIFGGEGSAQDPLSALNLRMLQSVANEINTPKPVK